MYKIFANDKLLSFNKKENKKSLNIPYRSKKTFDAALDILFNTQIKTVTILSPDKKETEKRFRKYVIPVQAAGGIVKNNEGKYLFIKRNGIWDLPKGMMEKGEGSKETAVREVEEECSITNLKLGKSAGITQHVYFNSRYLLKTVYWYSMKYTGNEVPQPQTEEGIEIASWFSKEEIPFLMENTYETIRTLVFTHILKKK